MMIANPDQVCVVLQFCRDAACDCYIGHGEVMLGLRFVGSLREDRMAKVMGPLFIISTAGQVADELARRGVAHDQPVMIAIEPDDWLTEVRRYARPRVIAKGWSDEDIDRIVDEVREAVQPLLK
jgi:hypothetical protein